MVSRDYQDIQSFIKKAQSAGTAQAAEYYIEDIIKTAWRHYYDHECRFIRREDRDDGTQARRWKRFLEIIETPYKNSGTFAQLKVKLDDVLTFWQSNCGRMYECRIDCQPGRLAA